MALTIVSIEVGDDDTPIDFSVGTADDWLDALATDGGFRAIRFATLQDAAEWLYLFNGQTFGGIVEFEDFSYGVYISRNSA